MIVQLIDTSTPRTDGKSGTPTQVTLNEEYVVIDETDTHYAIMNDKLKIGKYSKQRFVITDNTPIPDTKKEFNRLTTPLRLKIVELEREVNQLKKELGRI